MSNRCEAVMGSWFKPIQCSNTAKFTVDGKHYCGIHNPDKINKTTLKARYKHQIQELEAGIRALSVQLSDRLIPKVRENIDYKLSPEDKELILSIADKYSEVERVKNLIIKLA